MVLFENIMLNQRVEVLRGGAVDRGVVRFRGIINGIPGDWVGVEMDEPVGRGNGMINGRRYFFAKEGHAIFIMASHIRFIPQNRFMFNRYKPVRINKSYVEEGLFGDTTDVYAEYDDRRTPASWIDESFINQHTKHNGRARAVYNDDLYGVRKVYPRRHSISSLVPPASSRWSESLDSTYKAGSAVSSRSVGCQCYHPGVSSRPISCQCCHPREEFISPPSIPRPHMPHSCLKREIRSGWASGTHLPRNLSVNTARDSLSYLY